MLAVIGEFVEGKDGRFSVLNLTFVCPFCGM